MSLPVCVSLFIYTCGPVCVHRMGSQHAPMQHHLFSSLVSKLKSVSASVPSSLSVSVCKIIILLLLLLL